MLAPLKQFYCDTCGGVIQGPDRGLITWIPPDYDGPDDRVHGPHTFRIVHNVGYEPAGKPCIRMVGHVMPIKHPLQLASGPDAVAFWRARFLELLVDAGKIDAARYVELDTLLCRLAVPYFEEARRHLAAAEDEGYLDARGDFERMRQATLKDVIQVYGDHAA